MRHLVLFLLLLLPLHSIQAQNIVANPGFSDVNICTEYNYPCAPSAWESVAPNTSKIMYTQVRGNRYITITLYSSIDPNFRSYSETQLLCPLHKGQRYQLKLYTLMDEGRPYPLPGVLFDSVPVYRWTPRPLEQPATLYFNKDSDKHPEKKWTVLEKTFVAEANAKYMIIGNFDSALGHYPRNETFYLDIDSVSLVPLSGNVCANTRETAAKLYTLHDRHHFISPDKDLQDLEPVKTPKLQTVFYKPGSCDTLLLKSDFFLPKSKNINPSYAGQLESALKPSGSVLRHKIKLTGYVFKNASEKYNQVMAQDRAQAVASYMVYKKGFSFDDFIVTGVGKFTADGDSSERVEVINCQPSEEVTVAVTRTDTLLIPDLLFRVDSHQLEDKMIHALDSLIDKIPVGDHISLTVTGHTDNTGTNIYNQELSMRRAFTVSDYIRNKKPGSNITAVNGMGESMPVADNKTVAGRRKNRRVEVVIYYLSSQ
ncbi:OmpA family protein [Chitinophaga sp. RAB17]|uniref:OmpA family protein n=1 Tax=Chitinophaga sp. RAB17 TaxID=3233049 RepID=UPI003F903ADC